MLLRTSDISKEASRSGTFDSLLVPQILLAMFFRYNNQPRFKALLPYCSYAMEIETLAVLKFSLDQDFSVV